MEGEFFHDAGTVGFDGVEAEAELSGDLLIAIAFGEELVDVAFTFGEQIEAIVRGGVEDGLEEESADGRAEETLAAGDGEDGFDEFGFEAILEDIAASAFADGAEDVAFVGVHAEHEDGDGGVEAMQLGEGFEAVEALHADVEEDEIGGILTSEFDGFGAGAGFGDDEEGGMGFEDAADALADEGVIVGEEDAVGHLCDCL